MAIQRRLDINPSFNTNQFCILQEVIAKEGINVLFEYKLIIACANQELTATTVVGSTLDFSINDGNESNWENRSNYSGVVEELYSTGYQTYSYSGQTIRLKRYNLKVVPKFSLLKKTKHSRVYQKKSQTTTDIINALLEHYAINYENKINNPPTKEYCIQYNESDYDFINRLLFESGAFFYFQFASRKHTLILSNTTSDCITSSQPLSHTDDGLWQTSIKYCEVHNHLVSNIFAVNGFDPTQPDKSLYIKNTAKSEQKDAAVLIHFQYPSCSLIKKNSEIFNNAFLNNEEANSYYIFAHSNIVLNSSQIYNFTGNYFAKLPVQTVVISRLSWQCKDYRGFYLQDNAQKDFEYSNQLIAYPANVSLLPILENNKTFSGVQIATVVNAQGTTSNKQPFYYDSYGNLCIKFAWEDYTDSGLKTNYFDQTVTPVMHQWDNGIYRVGTVVIVGFINNNLDTPIVLGTLNNASSLPLGTFDESNAMQSLLMRRAGCDDGSNYNYLCLDDKQDNEVVDLFAGKDLNITVNKGDKTVQLNHGNHIVSIKEGHQSVVIIKDNQTITINKGDQTIVICEGNQVISIDKGKRQITVGNDETHVNEGNYTHTVTKNYTLNVTGNVAVSASKDITLKGNTILIKGTKVSIEGKAGIALKSMSINLN